MGVAALHTWDLVAEATGLEDLADAVLGHPGLETVPKTMRYKTVRAGSRS
jgi:hypothetical protein